MVVIRASFAIWLCEQRMRSTPRPHADGYGTVSDTLNDKYTTIA